MRGAPDDESDCWNVLVSGVVHRRWLASVAMTDRHVYVDESKERGYVMVASAHGPGDVAAHRKTLRGLVLPGQNRSHMAKERDGQRRHIVDTLIKEVGRTAIVYDAGTRYGSDQLAARRACVDAIVTDAGHQRTRLVLEQDDSLLRWDRQQLIEIIRLAKCRETLHYEHMRARSEPLLCVPRRDRVVLGTRRALAPAHWPASRRGQAGLDARNPAHPPSGRLPGPLP